mgnify:CR=1 FL=1
MTLHRLFALIFLAALSALPASAGERRQIGAELGCIRTIAPGDPLLKGIHAGGLPGHVLVEKCSKLWLSVSFRKGKMRLIPVQARFIPRFRARNKPFATPDARVTISDKNIREAWLTHPTRRYDHKILGDEIEGGGLAATLPRGRHIELQLEPGFVFEDRMARLVDLDGDGKLEIVTVLTDMKRGASLAVYRVRDEKIEFAAATQPIGKPHRWLNPAAVGDFDGDGRVEIAWVETPHIGGILKIARLTGALGAEKLEVIASLKGFSNHAAGSPELQQALSFDWDGDGRPDIILPGPERKTIRAVSFKDGKLKLIDEIEIGGVIDSPLVAADLNWDGKGEALLVTKDARLLAFGAF